ncbi:MAG: fused MFS/spermidine synthase [Phycisphaeraceae bacterium]
MVRFALTIFLSAFLLFQVQPLIGRYILPWFGGTNNVWTTCLLFFQIVLLGGYAYAHFLGKMPKKKQAMVHLTLLVLTLPFLPIAPSVGWKPGPENEPTLRILLLLLVTLGLPYLVLSTTGPLLQNWFAVTNPGRSPYRLYALSNVGSLLALITFPILVEPNLSRWQQVLFWSIGFAGFALCCGWCAVVLWKDSASVDPSATTDAKGKPEQAPLQLGAKTKAMPASTPPPPAPSPLLIAMWLGLATCGSAMLLATTNQLTCDTVPVPFLWVIPLALYLITFIICFDSERWYIRPVFGGLLVVSVPIAVYLLFEGVSAPLMQQIIGYSVALFACCMTCHGELVRSRPHPQYLTLFYLTISAGGALGGLFVAVVAPMTFTHFHEYHFALFGCVAITFLAWFREAVTGAVPKHAPAGGYLTAIIAVAVAVIVAFLVMKEPVTDWSGADESVFTQLKEGVSNYWDAASKQRVLKDVGPIGVDGIRKTTFIKFSAVLGLVLIAAGVIIDEMRAKSGRRPVLFLAGPSIAVLIAGNALIKNINEERGDVIYQTRNFYGVLQVKRDESHTNTFENDEGDIVSEDIGPWVRLVHGRIMHGFQFRHEGDPLHPARRWHTSYYGPNSGVGLAIQRHPKRLSTGPTLEAMHIGVIGLGTGTTATYGRKGDRVRIYEINPIVEHIARTYFTYLGDSPAEVKVVLGDARIMLERERDRQEIQKFDVLAVDAFSSDAIPIHLLTKECAALYFDHLNDDGILALHISNRFVRLEGVSYALAKQMGARAIYINNEDDEDHNDKGVSGSTWILLTKNAAFAGDEEVIDASDPWRSDETVTAANIDKIKKKMKDEVKRDKLQVGDPNPHHPLHLWTDDFASLWELLRF